MAKPFDPRKVLKHIANPLLREFFTRRGELGDVPWDELTEHKIEPVFDAAGIDGSVAMDRITTGELAERYAELHGQPCRTLMVAFKRAIALMRGNINVAHIPGQRFRVLIHLLIDYLNDVELTGMPQVSSDGRAKL